MAKRTSRRKALCVTGLVYHVRRILNNIQNNLLTTSPTIKDVARVSGVSQSTVSQVLHNGRRPVHPATRERVLRAAQELDYRPSAVARGLARRRMNTLGLAFLHGDISAQSNPFFLAVLDGVLSVCTRRHQSTMLHTFHDWDAPDGPTDMGDGRCDGVLLLVPPARCALAETLLKRRVPFVIVDGHDASGRMAYIDIDNGHAAAEMTGHLLGLGHRRIAFVYAPSNLPYTFAVEREAGYRKAMAAAGQDVECTVLTCEEVPALDWSAPDRPTALFCAYDAIALPLMDDLMRLGLRIPEDISVVGFDDVPGAAGAQPALTTMRQPMTELGERAAEMLLEIIDGGAGGAGRQLLLSTTLVVRASTASPPAA
jgi:DNA-binding LacI/PurR family transcriptional regulator